ncbi:MAG: hypothetical protein OES79_04990 [Planctomycetota bacterium]|nr:hypothetical protein [Planctomycetota bacterium]
MNIVFRAAVILCAAGCLTFVAGEAQAQNGVGCGNGYCGDGYYYGFYRRRLNSDFQLPPYFAQFPPVYYSGPPIPRTYGWSPFALRPTEYDYIPQLKAKPVMMHNPYVTEAGEAEEKKTDDKTAAAAKVIINPYIQDDLPVRVARHALQR